MEDLLLRLLCIDTENTIMVALFLCYCVHIPTGTLGTYYIMRDSSLTYVRISNVRYWSSATQIAFTHK